MSSQPRLFRPVSDPASRLLGPRLHARFVGAVDAGGAAEERVSRDESLAGSAASVSTTVGHLVDEVYRLCLRMLWHPIDAEEASRDIFRAVLSAGPLVPREAELRLSVLRVAVKHLLESPNSLFERQRWTFDALAEDLGRGSDQPMPARPPKADPSALEEEVKIGCTQTILLCLDRPDRLAYLLSVVGLGVVAAADLMNIGPEAYRQRLTSAQVRVQGFMQGNCGLVNSASPCRCNRRLARALFTGRVDPEKLLFVSPKPVPVAGPAMAVAGPDASPCGQGIPDVSIGVFRNQRLKSAPRSLILAVTDFARQA